MRDESPVLTKNKHECSYVDNGNNGSILPHRSYDINCSVCFIGCESMIIQLHLASRMYIVIQECKNSACGHPVMNSPKIQLAVIQ